MESTTLAGSRQVASVRVRRRAGRGSATCLAAGVLALDGIVNFDADRIIHLEDCYEDRMKEELVAYVEEHADTVGLEVGCLDYP
jgi:hypothetical protein